ncbi:MAG: tyrosine-type recombinase/integrase [Gillisia sp.]
MKNKRPKEWLTKKEFNQMINYPYITRREELIISMLYYCALRVSELINLRVRDINIDNATITVREGKRSKGPALVPLPEHLLKMLTQWIFDNNLTKTRFLLFSKHNKNLSRVQIHRIVKEVGKKAGIEKEITTHTFRRTRAIHLLDDGLPIEQYRTG